MIYPILLPSKIKAKIYNKAKNTEKKAITIGKITKINNKKISKNKFVNANKNKQKNKKNFEVRDGDWICSKCNNLNFSFRIKCNRCSLPKELSKNMQLPNQNMPNQNQHY